MSVCVSFHASPPLWRDGGVSLRYIYIYTHIHWRYTEVYMYLGMYAYTYLFRETAVSLFNPLERYQFLPPHSLLDAHLESVRDLRKCGEDKHHPVPLGRQLANSLDNLIPGSVCVCVCVWSYNIYQDLNIYTYDIDTHPCIYARAFSQLRASNSCQIFACAYGTRA